MAGDLFGLSAADRDVLLRMIARERANYPGNVRSLAPVPKKKIEWKPSTTPRVAWLNTLRTSYTYTGGGSEKELQFTSKFNASDGTMDLLETVTSSGYYTKIELSEKAVYQVSAHASFDSSGWTYATFSDALGDAFDEASMRIQVLDSGSNEVSVGLPRQWVTPLAYYKFSLSCGGLMSLTHLNQSQFPVTVRVLVFGQARDFTANSVSGSFSAMKIRDRLDD